MSRLYEMTVQVTKFKADHWMGIENAAEEEWPDFGHWDRDHDRSLGGVPIRLMSTGKGSLCGGETEQHFADRLSAVIMQANQGPCEVEVTATCLEDLPFERFVLGVDDFERLDQEFPKPKEEDDDE